MDADKVDSNSLLVDQLKRGESYYVRRVLFNDEMLSSLTIVVWFLFFIIKLSK